MPAPAGALAAAEQLSGSVALVRQRSAGIVDQLVAVMSVADLEGSYLVAEPSAVAGLVSAHTAAADAGVRAAGSAVGAWSVQQDASSMLPDTGGVVTPPGDLALVLRQTVLTETLYRIGTGMRPAEALESARLRGGRATANIGADTGRGAYTRHLEGAGMGWARVPAGQACPWCLLMASRGAVYRTEQTAQGRHGYYHPWDRCRTLAVPRGRSPGDYLAGETGELVDRAADAWNRTGKMDAYLRSDFAKAQNLVRAEVHGQNPATR